MPICARPFAPPPLKVSPIFGLLFNVESWPCEPKPKAIKQKVINRVRTVVILKMEIPEF
jgi:hypothetical protein